MHRIASAFQHNHISCFKAESEGICRHIRSGFVNNANHAKRNPFLTDQQSVRAFFHRKHFPDRVFQPCDLYESFCHLGNAVFGQQQTVQKSLMHPGFFSGLHIFFIFCDQIICFLIQCICNCFQCLILFCCPKQLHMRLRSHRIHSNLVQCSLH